MPEPTTASYDKQNKWVSHWAPVGHRARLAEASTGRTEKVYPDGTNCWKTIMGQGCLLNKTQQIGTVECRHTGFCEAQNQIWHKFTFFLSFPLCVWLALWPNRHEGQVAPRWVLPSWWFSIGVCCPFTIQVPSALAGSDGIPVTERQQRDRGRRRHNQS